jgi:hypothetical protein
MGDRGASPCMADGDASGSRSGSGTPHPNDQRTTASTRPIELARGAVCPCRCDGRHTGTQKERARGKKAARVMRSRPTHQPALTTAAGVAGWQPAWAVCPYHNEIHRNVTGTPLDREVRGDGALVQSRQWRRERTGKWRFNNRREMDGGAADD